MLWYCREPGGVAFFGPRLKWLAAFSFCQCRCSRCSLPMVRFIGTERDRSPWERVAARSWLVMGDLKVAMPPPIAGNMAYLCCFCGKLAPAAAASTINMYEGNVC